MRGTKAKQLRKLAATQATSPYLLENRKGTSKHAVGSLRYVYKTLKKAYRMEKNRMNVYIATHSLSS